MSGVIGRKTIMLDQPAALNEALDRYRGKYVLIVDPEYRGSQMVDGSVVAVSETEHGIRRAARHLPPWSGPLRIRIERLI